MDKRTLKIITVILLAVLLLGAAIYFCIQKQHEKELLSDQGTVYEEYVEPKVYVDNSVKAVLYLPNKDLTGYIKKEVTYKGEGLEIQRQMANDILFNYLKDYVYIPAGTEITDLKIWDETLKINFNKKALGMKVKDPRAEKYVIGALVNSLLTTSKEFTDVQFLVENERVDRLFGHINTRNPFMFVR